MKNLTAEETVSNLIGDSITIKDRFSGGGGDSASSLQMPPAPPPPLVVAAALSVDDEPGDDASEASALDAVRLMPFPLQATVVADCIYYSLKCSSSISCSLSLSFSLSFL